MNNQTNNSSGKLAAKNNRNRNRKRTNNKRRPNSNGPKLSTLEKAYRSYLNLLEKHLDARRKYFELFHRADPRQLAKLERNFNGAIKDLRDFEDNLSPDIKDDFNKKVNGLKTDTIYSTNHELSPDSQEVEKDLPDEEPHFLESQKESFNEDTEETKGAMDDYYAYKGLTPPEKEEEEAQEKGEEKA